MTKKKIILFGGSGFIGFNLVKKLKEYKFDITSVSRKKIDKKFKLNKIKYLRCDVSKYSSLKKIKSDFDYIINLSGNINHRNTKETIKPHFLGTKNLIDFF